MSTLETGTIAYRLTGVVQLTSLPFGVPFSRAGQLSRFRPESNTQIRLLFRQEHAANLLRLPWSPCNEDQTFAILAGCASEAEDG